MPRLRHVVVSDRLGGANLLLGSRFDGYEKLVLGTRRNNLVGYWPLFDPSGAVAQDRSGNGNPGAYTAVTLLQPGIGDGHGCPLFDGVNGYVNLFTTTFRDYFVTRGCRNVGTLAIFYKPINAAVWTDGTVDEMFRISFSTQTMALRKSSTNNQLVYFFTGSSGGVAVSYTVAAPTAWLHLALTYSVAGNAMKAYLNGSQVGTTQAGFGAINTAMTLAVIGSQTTAINRTNGWLAHGALWSIDLTATEIKRLARA